MPFLSNGEEVSVIMLGKGRTCKVEDSKGETFWVGSNRLTETKPMGWNAEDSGPKQAAILAAQSARVEIYRLIKTLKEIQHPEKGPILVKMGDELYSLTEKITAQLER